MRKYNLIKDRTATPNEVFENLKNGGLKLLCFNKETGLWSQVAWCWDGKIEIITIENDMVVGQYFISFNYENVCDLKLNTTFFKNKTWWLGYIQD